MSKFHFSYVRTNFASSGKASTASKKNFVRASPAACRSVVVSKIVLKRTRRSYSVRSCGMCVNNSSNLVRSFAVKSLGSRRNCHISARNSFCWARDSFALYWRVIFFSLAVDRVVEQFGHMKPINHPCRVGQELGTHAGVGCPHVDAITAHALTLLFRQTLQALRRCRLIAPLDHRQHLG